MPMHSREQLDALRRELQSQLAKTRWLRRLCLTLAVVEIAAISMFWADHILGR